MPLGGLSSELTRTYEQEEGLSADQSIRTVENLGVHSNANRLGGTGENSFAYGLQYSVVTVEEG